LDGYNGAIFAYGQTGSGKIYTIMGAKEYMERRNIDIDFIFGNIIFLNQGCNIFP
jgi:hypothetical protein